MRRLKLYFDVVRISPQFFIKKLFLLKDFTYNSSAFKKIYHYTMWIKVEIELLRYVTTVWM